MKRASVAGLVVLSLGLSTQAMAKDLDSIDLFVGDFVGVATVDVAKLASNKMLSDVFEKGEASMGSEIAALKAAGIDYKKDLSSFTIAVTEKGKACAAVDAKKSLKAVFDDYVKKNNLTGSDYNGVMLYQDNGEVVALLSDKRLAMCENPIDIKPSIDNMKAAKPVLMKDRMGAIYNMYSQLSSKADIRFAGKMTPHLVKNAQTYKIDSADGSKSFAVVNGEAGAVSVSFASGLDVQAIAKMKNEQFATDGAAVLNEQASVFLSEDQLNELQMGFLAKAYTITADKKQIKASVKLTNEQMGVIMVMLNGLMDSGDVSAVAPRKASK